MLPEKASIKPCSKFPMNDPMTVILRDIEMRWNGQIRKFRGSVRPDAALCPDGVGDGSVRSDGFRRMPGLAATILIAG